MVLLALAAFGADPSPAAPAGPWKPVLDDPAYRFCNEGGVDAADARDFCELMKDVPRDRCPGLRETCDKSTRKDDVDLWEAVRSGCQPPGDKRGFSPAEKPPAPMQCDAQSPQAGGAGALLRWVVALLVAFAVMVVARLLWQYLALRGRAEPQPAPPPPVVTDSPPPDDIPDAPSDDLLSAARRALGEGRTADAVLLARAAALRRLGEAGRIFLHRARTDREYVRAVRKEPAVAEPLREVVRVAEDTRFGGRSPDPGIAAAALAAAERVLAAIGASLLLLALLEGDARAGRFGPYDDAALYDLYASAGYDVSWRLRGLQSLGDDSDVLVLDVVAVDVEDEADRAALRTWVENGGVVVVAGPAADIWPDLGVVALPNHEDGTPDVGVVAGAEGDTDTDATADTDDEAARQMVRHGPAARGPDLTDADLPVPRFPFGPQLAYAGGKGRVLVQTDGPGGPVAVVEVLSVGKGGVVAVADRRLLVNGSLVHPANEAFVAALPYAAADTGAFALPVPARVQLATRAGSDTNNPVGALANAHLLPFVAQLLLTGTLVALWKGWPFAPLRDPPDEGRLAFAEHVRALGLRYARTGASRRAVSLVARLWLGRLGKDGLELAARRAGFDAAKARDLAAAVERAAGDADGPNTPADLALMEDLWRVTRP